MSCPLCADQKVVSVVPVTAGALNFEEETFVACICMPHQHLCRREELMGFNTAVMFCNDMFGDLKAHPEEFVAGIVEHYNRGGDFGVGCYGNGVTVLASEHADATQLIAVGGNFATKVYTGYYVGSHHTPEGQVALLKQWADHLGYRISKKPGENK